MDTKFSNKTVNLPLWRGVAIVAGVFAILICAMVIVNYMQINKVDPVNTEVINSLVERLNDNPNDVQLREQIHLHLRRHPECKQEVLKLFTNKDIDKHIEDQLKNCRNFIQMKLQ